MTYIIISRIYGEYYHSLELTASEAIEGVISRGNKVVTVATVTRN